MKKRKIDNPLLNKIEREASRAENIRALKEVGALIVTVLLVALFIWGIISIFKGKISSSSDIIIEDSRGPELKKLYKEILK